MNNFNINKKIGRCITLLLAFQLLFSFSPSRPMIPKKKKQTKNSTQNIQNTFRDIEAKLMLEPPKCIETIQNDKTKQYSFIRHYDHRIIEKVEIKNTGEIFIHRRNGTIVPGQDDPH